MTPEESSSKNNIERRAALHCLNFGDKFIRERSWQNAITWLKQAVTIQPDFFEAYCLLGEAYMELGQVEEAIETLDRAIQLRPKDTNPHLKLGLAYIALHDWNAALGQFHTLRRLDQVMAKQLFDKIIFSFNYNMFDSLFNQIY
ncbi:MAG: hypothetical protein QOJ02_4282 [Acidobacteriota bacterium]|jgi:tetratricopeptide (TPR) repeat protein|nr:hypothetical protein [Acidobacteriota bacterium]